MYKKGSKGWLKHLDFIILDLICMHVSLLLAFFIRHGIGNMYMDERYRTMAIVLTMIQILTVIFFDSMKNVLKRGYYKEFIYTIRHVFLVILITMGYLFSIQRSEDYSRIILYLTGIIYAIIGYVVRNLWKVHLLKKMASGGKRSLLVVTTTTMAEDIVNNIRQNNFEMLRIVGIALMDAEDEKVVGTTFASIPVVAGRDSIVDYACREWVDEVFVEIPDEMPYPEDLMDQFAEMGMAVHFALTHVSSIKEKNQFVERIGNYTVLTTSINSVSASQLILKRLLDIVGGLVGCLITGILFIFLAPAIYIQSPGPIFFKQERVGKNGKKFKMYKFRSMYMDAEERKKELMKDNRVADGMMFKLDFDPRIIGAKKLPDGTIKKGVGNFIRDFSLDEFPQFFNVLKGDMSLVGTRPPTVDEWEKYELHHRARLAIKPGVTGMWQVSGRSNITNFEEVVKLDTKYITEWSMALDLKILLKTILVVFKKEGSM